MSCETIDRMVASCPRLMLAGVTLWWLGLGMTGVYLIGLAALVGSLREWKTEPGLWMLSALFGVLFGSLFLAFVYFSIVDFLAGRGPVCGIMAVDIAVTSMVLATMLRFTWAVTWWNRGLARP